MIRKIQTAVETWIFKLVTPLLMTLTISLFGFLFLQSINRVSAAENEIKASKVHTERLFKEACSKMEHGLEKKVDGKHFDTMLKIIQEEQKTARGERKDNNKLMQEMNTNILLLNERLKQ